MSYVVLQLDGRWDGEVGEVLDLEGSDAALVDQLSEYPYPQVEHEWGHLLAVEKAAYQAYASLVRLAETLDAAPEIHQQIDQVLLNWRPQPEPDWRPQQRAWREE